jgi:hypothetical protein
MRALLTAIAGLESFLVEMGLVWLLSDCLVLDFMPQFHQTLLVVSQPLIFQCYRRFNGSIPYSSSNLSHLAVRISQTIRFPMKFLILICQIWTWLNWKLIAVLEMRSWWCMIITVWEHFFPFGHQNTLVIK